MNIQELASTAANEKGLGFSMFKSKPSKQKIIAALVDWSQDLSKKLGESHDRERELQNENSDLKCQNAQLEERLEAVNKEIMHFTAKESQLELKISKSKNSTKETEEKLSALTTQKYEFELEKQRLESDIARLKEKIKEKEEKINQTEDALEKCRHDCTNIETKYQTAEKEKAKLEDKLEAFGSEKASLVSETESLHSLVKTEEKKLKKLKKDLSTTRQLLNESHKDKQHIEKEMSAEMEGLKYQVFALNKSLYDNKMQAETLKNEKQMLMVYYRDKQSAVNGKNYNGQQESHPAICPPILNKDVQTSYFESTVSSLKNKILNLEFQAYRNDKLVEALVDIIQSHDPNFKVENNEILHSYIDQKKVNSKESQTYRYGIQHLEPGCSNDLDNDLYKRTEPRCSHDDMISSISTCTCVTANTSCSRFPSSDSLDIETDTSTVYSSTASESDTNCSLYSDLPKYGSH